MKYSTFNKKQVDALKEPMFLGENVNVARYDQQKYPFFERLIEKQISFFWRPEEVNLTRDKIDFADMPPHAQHIFLSNLKYQTLLDSVQGRAPNIALLPIVSIPELETWIETWSFFETIHSRSYTHIIRNVVNDPGIVFDDIVTHKEITKRAESVTDYYDQLTELCNYYNMLGEGKHTIKINGGEEKVVHVSLRAIKKLLYLTMHSINALEGIRFYVSFACSFAFGEAGKMVGNAKVIKLIARDEAVHLSGTQYMINLMTSGREDMEFMEIALECQDEVLEMYRQVAQQEKDWAKYLFKDGSVLGLSEQIVCNYVEFITNLRMGNVNLPPIFEDRTNPLPWVHNNWLESDGVQPAPQESEISSYLVSQIDQDMSSDDIDGLDLDLDFEE